MRLFISVCTAATILLTLLAGCKSGKFKVEGEAQDLGSQNLRIVYYANGAVQSMPASAVNGQFSFEGVTDNPAVVSIYASDRSLLGRVIVEGDETVKATFVKGKPYAVTAEGNKMSEELTRFLADNKSAFASGRPADINKAVATYVTAHPDDLLSTVLIVTVYDANADPSGALALYNKLTPQVRPMWLVGGFAESLATIERSLKSQKVMPLRYYSKRDSLTTFTPRGSARTLLVFTASDAGRDTIIKPLRQLSSATDRRQLRVLEISSDVDSMIWRHSIASDTANWIQGWMPASLSAQGADILAVTDLPFFILVDSAGHQLLRTRSVTSAVEGAKKP